MAVSLQPLEKGSIAKVNTQNKYAQLAQRLQRKLYLQIFCDVLKALAKF